MLGDEAVPSCPWHVPSLMLTYHWPPLSPLRLNWMVELMPFAASAFKFLGISAKISLGVMQTPPLGGWGWSFPRASNLALSRTTGVRIVKRARGVAFDARIRWVEPHRRPAKTLAHSPKPVPAERWLAVRADGGRMPRRARLPAYPPRTCPLSAPETLEQRPGERGPAPTLFVLEVRV